MVKPGEAGYLTYSMPVDLDFSMPHDVNYKNELRRVTTEQSPMNEPSVKLSSKVQTGTITLTDVVVV